MSLDRPSLPASGNVSSGDVRVLQAFGVEHLLERRHRAVMQVPAAIPKTPERRHLVVTRALARLQSKSGIGAHRNRQYVERRGLVRRDLETFGKGELVVGMERWRVAVYAPFSCKDLPARLRLGVVWIWIFQGLRE